ncbi:MAG TPA: response regulator, partial [Alphaproteobacteria bacterium]|nr:response regulator [Alphaproteobacteria bacterium]
GRDNGMTEFLMKPYTARDMYKKIVQLIERPRQFVKAEGYFGPDRRRKREEYVGPIRRMKDLYNQQNKELHDAADIVMIPKKDGVKDITSK